MASDASRFMNPKYSILLPTRNGGALLEGCIRSVLSQERDDFELVVSDNASDEESQEAIRRFADDSRLVTLRQSEPLGVTGNWLACLDKSRGERIALIGDDDRLLPGYFEAADVLVDTYRDPDVVLCNGIGFLFPGLEGSTQAHFSDPFYEMDPTLPRDGLISQSVRRRLVTEMFAFRFPIHMNMQAALIHRRCLDMLPGRFFRDPFPDFYTMNALMLKADTWALSSETPVVIGVSPKSYGRTIHNAGQQDEGLAYLGIDLGFPGWLPGNDHHSGTWKVLLALKEDFPDELAGCEIDRQAYVVGQVRALVIQYQLGGIERRELLRRLRLLSARDCLAVGTFALNLRRIRMARSTLTIDAGAALPQLWPGMQPLPTVRDIDEFLAWLALEERERPA